MTEKKNPKITVAPYGPYIVSGLEQLHTAEGPLESKPSMALCRCGGSKNKPFCDGTHAAIGFSGENSADANRDKRQSYAGAEITVHDNRSICAHAGRCTEGLPAVFRMKQEPWIDADGAKADEIIALVKQCPSGALSFSVRGVEHQHQQTVPGITVARGGPYVVTGSVELVDVSRADGASEQQCTLCRCGASKNKPFCDGAHWNVEFDNQNEEA